MTTKPVAHRPVGNARFVTEDTAGTQQSLGGVRAGWPLSIVRTGAGTTSDANTWDEQAAVVLDLTLSVINPILPTSELTGGTARVEVDIAGQSAYGGSDGWTQVCPTIRWLNGALPFNLWGLLGKAHVLTRTGSAGARIRVTVTGTDEVNLYALVAPVVANPGC